MSRSAEAASSVRVVDAPGQREPYVAVQHLLLDSVIVASVLLATGGVLDRYSLPRATWYAIVVVLLAAVSALRAAQVGSLHVPRSPVVLAVLPFLMALVVSVVVSDLPMRSVIGPYTRYTGLAMYVVYVALMVFVMRCHDRRTVGRLAGVFAAALAVVASYGVLQLAGADPISWPGTENDALSTLSTDFATFGNVNFASAFVGICWPFAVWVVLSTRFAPWLRIGAAATALLSIVYVVGNGSAQGPIAIVAGTAVIAVAWLAEHRDRFGDLGRGVRRALVGGAVLVIVLLAAVSPRLVQFVSDELSTGGGLERRQMWGTAVDLWSESPIVGHGLGSFAWEFTANRPEAHAVLNTFLNVDAPHNVVLAMAVGGGLLLAAAYLALVAYTGFVLVRGLRRTSGDQRVLLGAFGGAWLAYQVQSMLSIDVPPVAVLHWILTGAVFVVASPPTFYKLRIGAPPRKGRGRARSRLTPASAAVVGVVALALMFPVTRPYRADLASARAVDARAVNNFAAMLEHAKQATELAPWEADYWAQRAAALDGLGELEAARDAGIEATQRDPGSPFYALSVAGLSERLGELDVAERWMAEALERDPHNPRVIEAAEKFRAATAGS